MELLNSKNLGWLAIAFSAIGLVSLVAAVASNSNDKIGAASAFLITGAAIFTAATKFHSEERDRAFKFLNEYSNNKELLDALGFVGKVINKNEKITHEIAKNIYLSSDFRDEAFKKKMFFVYNFFEEIAIGIRFKQINEDIIKEFYSGMLYRFYNYTSVFLPIIRNSPTSIENHPFGKTLRPDMFVNVDWLYIQWKDFYESYLPQKEGTIEAKWAKK